LAGGGALKAKAADETTCSYRYGSSFSFPDTKLIHVDLCAEEIGKNYPADLGVVADLKMALRQFEESYDGQENREAYRSEITGLREAWAAQLAAKRQAKTENCTISQLIGEMNRVLPKETIIATSSGNTQAQLFQEYSFAKPYTNLTTGGCIGRGWRFHDGYAGNVYSGTVPDPWDRAFRWHAAWPWRDSEYQIGRRIPFGRTGKAVSSYACNGRRCSTGRTGNSKAAKRRPAGLWGAL